MARFYARELGLDYPPRRSSSPAARARSSTASTARSSIPGDAVVYPVPSWNNNHYCHMLGAREVAGRVRPGDALPADPRRAASARCPARGCSASTRRSTRPAPRSRPRRCAASARRSSRRTRAASARGERPLYLMYDHIYWMLCVEGVEHVTPTGLVPEMAPYTDLRRRHQQGVRRHRPARRLVGRPGRRHRAHVRAPRSRRRVGAARRAGRDRAPLLDDPAAIDAFLADFRPAVNSRLGKPARGLPSRCSTRACRSSRCRRWARST